MTEASGGLVKAELATVCCDGPRQGRSRGAGAAGHCRQPAALGFPAADVFSFSSMDFFFMRGRWRREILLTCYYKN
jgi:hypothetical protein